MNVTDAVPDIAPAALAVIVSVAGTAAEPLYVSVSTVPGCVTVGADSVTEPVVSLIETAIEDE